MTNLTAREARNINPTMNQLQECVEFLVSSGWNFKNEQSGQIRYGFGWWVNQTHETKNRPGGDAQSFYEAAWFTFKTYVAA